MKKVLLGMLAIMLVAVGFGCSSSDLQKSRQIQQSVLSNAFDSVPPYQPNDFAARKAINWYLEETESFETWYVYAVNRDGTPMFYVVSDFKPQNICVSITSPDRAIGQGGSMSAPALDGVYYGGAGCYAYYMRDANTGGFIELAGQTYTLISSKTPLFLETDVKRLEIGN